KSIEIDRLFQLDKLIHFVLFFILMALMLLAKSSRTVADGKTKFVLLVYCVLFGLLVEFVQGSSWIGRGFDWFDLLADGLGAFIAMISFEYWYRLLPLAKKYLPFVKNLY